MEALYARAFATLFPTLAEGCGLPLLESLWHGLPCLCSDLPVLRENADLGGCLPLAPNDEGAWNNALEELLEDRELWLHLAKEARTRPLPTWEASAGVLQSELTP
jgi:glycosyltransferase involved in cell wall biosynthesis